MAEYLSPDELIAALRAARPAATAPAASSPDSSGEALLARIMSQQRASGEPDRAAAVAGRPQAALTIPRLAHKPRLPLAAAGLALTAVAGALIVAVQPSGTSSTSPPGAAAGAYRVETAAYVLSRINTSASAILGDVIQVHSSAGHGYTEDDWYGPRNSQVRLRTYGPGGKLLFEVGETSTRITVIDYADRSWWTYPGALPAHPTVVGCGVPRCAIIEPGRRGDGGIPAAPALLRSLVTIGQYRIAAAGTIRGQRADELTPGPHSRQPAGSLALWVDAASFLPLRFVAWDSTSGSTTRSDIYYLAPTQANLAQLTITIPAGFSRSRAPRRP